MKTFSVAWDGRNDTGQFVTDGQYRIHVLDYDFFVTVDTQAPAATIAMGSAFHTMPEKLTCANPTKGEGCVRISGPLVETPYVLLTGSVADPQIAKWTLEVGSGTNPT